MPQRKADMKGGFIRSLGRRGLQKLKWVIALLSLIRILASYHYFLIIYKNSLEANVSF